MWKRRPKDYNNQYSKFLYSELDALERKKLAEEERKLREAAKLEPAYIRNEKMRKLLQHNAEFLKNHKGQEISIEEYKAECLYQADNVLSLITYDLQDKERNFENMAEIISFYKTNLKFICEYSNMVAKANPSIRINEMLFFELVKLNPYFLCSAPLRCFLKSGLPINQLDEESIQKYIQPRIAKTSLTTNQTFLNNYGKYFNFNLTV